MADSKKVNYELRAEDQFSAVFDKLKGRLTDTEAHFSRMKGVVAGAFAGVSIAGITAMIRSVAEAGNEAYKMAQKVGVGVEAWQKLVYVAKLADVAQESLAKSLKGLNTNILEAVDGNDKAVDLFKRLGVTIKDAGGQVRPTVQILMDLADVFTTMKDGPLKSALAVQAFGKVGMDMIPILNQGRAGIEALMKEAERLGVVMDERTAASSEALNDSFTRLSAATRGVWTQAIAPLIPFIEKMAESFTKSRTEGDKLANTSKIIETGLKLVGSVAIIVKGTFEAIGTLIGGIAAAWVAWASLKPGETMKILSQSLADVATITDRNKGLLRELWEGTTAGAPKATAAVRDFAGSALKSKSAIEDLTASLQKELLQLNSQFSNETKQQQVLIELAKDKYSKIRAGERDRVLALAKSIDAEREFLKQYKELIEGEAALTQGWKDQRSAVDQFIGSLRQSNKDLQLEADTIGLTNKERELANLALEKERALRGNVSEAQRKIIDDLYAERAAIIDTKAAREEQLSLWNDIAQRGSQLFSDLATKGKSAFDVLKNALKDFAREMLALFAKRFILQIGAAATGSAALGSQAASTGSGTLAGYAGSAVSGYLGYGAAGLTTGGTFATGFSAGSAGLGGTSFTGMAAFGETLGTIWGGIADVLAMIPVWGWIAAAVIAIAVWLGGRNTGGPKVGGSFLGAYSGTGDFMGDLTPTLDRSRNLHDETQADSLAQRLVGGINTSFQQMLQRFGGTSSGVQFGLGFNKDPLGNAPSMVSSMVRDANGNVLFSQANRDVGRKDEEVQAEIVLQSKRAVLAALQDSELPAALKRWFNAANAATITSEQLDQLFAGAEAIKGMMDDVTNLDAVITDLQSGDGLATFTASLDAMQTSVVNAQRAFEAAKLGDDPQAVLATERQLAQAIMQRYQAEIQMVRTLQDAIRQVEEQAYQFAINIAQRINSVGGSRDVGQIALDRANVLRGRVGSGPLSFQIEDVQGYVGAIDTWYQARRADIERQMAAEQAAAQAIINAQASAAAARVSQLQSELAMVQQFQTIVDRTRQMLDDMRLSSANPLAASGRLALARDDVTRLRGEYQAATGDARITAANRLLDALQTLKSMGMEQLDRPSPEWQALYNEIASEITAVQGDAKSVADRGVELQEQLVNAQSEQNRLQSMVASATTASSEKLGALDVEAQGYYTWAEQHGAALFEQQRVQHQQQLDAITKGQEPELFIAARTSEMVDELKGLRADINAWLNTSSHGPGAGDGGDGGGGGSESGATVVVNVNGNNVSTEQIVAAVQKAAPYIRRVLVNS